MSLFKSRVLYLLNRDFEGTGEKFRTDPNGLKQEVLEVLRRAGQYAKELKQNRPQLNSMERGELVQNFVAPTDVEDRWPPDENLYEQIMDWADVQEDALMKTT
jgi:hypothetical protein